MRRRLTESPFQPARTRRFTPDKALAHWFRIIYRNLNIEPMDFERYLNDYLEDPRNVPDPSKISSERTNIIRALTDERMSWKTFMRALKILKVEHATLRIDTVRKGGTEYFAHPLHLDMTEILPKPGTREDAAGKETREDASIPAPLSATPEKGSTDPGEGTD